MDDIKPPNTWRRPRSKVYDYNQKFGGNYYQPMIDYIDTKDRQGVFFERPTERIQLPDPVEVVCSDKYKKSCEDAGGDHNVARYLTKAYAQQIKEQNMSTVKTRMNMLKTMTTMKNLPHTPSKNQQTHFDDVRLLKGAPPGRQQCNFYTGELGVLKVSKDWQDVCTTHHMKDVAVGRFDGEAGNYGQGGTPFGENFYDGKLIKDVVNSIKFVNPERSIPVV